MKYNPIPLLLFVLFFLPQLQSQTIFPIDTIVDEQNIIACEGIFTDSSLGDSLIAYNPNESHQLTFVSTDPGQSFLAFSFDMFGLGNGDTLYVYDGPDSSWPLIVAATHQALSGEIIYASNESIHFHFVSSDFDPDDPDDVGGRLGWYAPFQCLDLCALFAASIETDDPSDLMQCPEDPQEVTFYGSATYLPENFDYDPINFLFTWIIEEETFSGPQVSYLFEEPGAYTIRLIAEDAITGCIATAVEVLMVGTIPTFTGTMPSDTIVCAEENFTLTGIANPTTWTGFPIAVEEDPPFLIGLEETFYESSLFFDVFSEGLEVLSAEDFDRICVYVEHVDQSQLKFELESPDGVVVQLKDIGGPTANLGEPVVWNDDIPGKPYAYCFSPFPQYGTFAETTALFHEYTDNAGNYYFNALYMPPGNYTPEESLNAFAGSPLNGTWTMRIEDVTIGETGHIFGWSLLFDDQFYPDSLIFTPEIVQEQWYRDGVAIPGNPATTNITEAGEYTFLFEVTDNFGCIYDTTFVVEVLRLPRAEIISELEIPICEGDSTLLTVLPLNSDGFSWKYQWQLGGVDLPGRTYDTLMVKEPSLYTVMISEPNVFNTDTLWCLNFFEKDVTDQNCDLTIPNVFTPNNDGINDLFEIRNLEHYPNAQIVIYNRWGSKVFEHNDYYNNWWDGNNVPDGTYIYILRYTRMGKTRYAEGTVTIIR